MRPAAFALCIVSLAACGDSTQVKPVTVQWMDWPAEVISGQPFRTRLVVWGICAMNPRFGSGASADQSAVTFTPYFLVEDNRDIACLQNRTTEFLLVIAIDTAGTAPGLAADVPRTYEMRAPIFAYTVQPVLVPGGLPVQTFGEVTVRLPGSAILARRNAGGTVGVEIDTPGCTRLRPVGLYGPNATLVLENPTDTVGLSGRFVRGYIYEPAAPMCGDTRVFHLVARE